MCPICTRFAFRKLVKMLTLSLSHPDSDSISPGKEGSRKELILKISPQVILMLLKYEKYWPLCSIQMVSMSFFNWYSKLSFHSPTFNSVSSPLVLLNRMEQSPQPISWHADHRALQLSCSGQDNSGGSWSRSSLPESQKSSAKDTELGLEEQSYR